nr:MAG TPA: hypothetical protein [Caudoviricetes sp.]
MRYPDRGNRRNRVYLSKNPAEMAGLCVLLPSFMMGFYGTISVEICM